MKNMQTVWPVDRVSLAALIDLGLSGEQIAAYFMVGKGDVDRLRDQFDFRRPSSRLRKMPFARKESSPTPLRHEFAESVAALRADIEALRKSGLSARLLGVIEETGRQLDEVVCLFDDLRRKLIEHRDSLSERPQVEVTAIWLRGRALHCRRLADQAVSVKIAGELEKLAADYEKEADGMERQACRS